MVPPTFLQQVLANAFSLDLSEVYSKQGSYIQSWKKTVYITSLKPKSYIEGRPPQKSYGFVPASSVADSTGL